MKFFIEQHQGGEWRTRKEFAWKPLRWGSTVFWLEWVVITEWWDVGPGGGFGTGKWFIGEIKQA